MPAPTIDYFFTVMSPWTYLGHDALKAIATRHGATIIYRPVSLGDVFDATGSLPLAKRPPARQRYRWVEMQRWRDKRGLPLTFKPAHWPVAVDPVNRAIVAIAAAGGDPHAFTGRALAGVWAEDRNLGDPAVIAAMLAACGHDPAAILAAAESPAVEALYQENKAAAIAADVFGAPAYVRDGEVFWGQDRLDLLDDALASGRPAYRPL
jgi:2-hydroxychromene-2-carboxylate isomerase